MPLPSVLYEIDRLFDELIRRPWGAASRQLVPAEIHEVQDGWMIVLPVEGMRAADLNVEVHGRQLTVTGHRRREHEHHRGTTSWTRLQEETALHRTITLPTEADANDVEAKIEGSTLTIHVRRRTR